MLTHSVPNADLIIDFMTTMYYRTVNEGLDWKVEDCEELLANVDDNYAKEVERFMNREGVTSIRWIKPEGVGALTDEIRDHRLDCASVLCDILNCTERGVYYRRLLGEQIKDSRGYVTRGLATELYAAILDYIKWNNFMGEAQGVVLTTPLSEALDPDRYYEFKDNDKLGFRGKVYVPETFSDAFTMQFEKITDKQLYYSMLAMGYPKWTIPYNGKGEATKEQREVMLMVIYNYLSTLIASRGKTKNEMPEPEQQVRFRNPNFKVYN